MSIGFTLPFARSTGSLGYFECTSSELDAVRQNLKSLLLTNWGERVMHYYFGANLIEFTFTNSRNAEIRQRIQDRIVDQVSKWMPFVAIDLVQVVFPEDEPSIPEHAIAIRLEFRISGRPDSSDFLEIMT